MPDARPRPSDSAAVDDAGQAGVVVRPRDARDRSVGSATGESAADESAAGDRAPGDSGAGDSAASDGDRSAGGGVATGSAAGGGAGAGNAVGGNPVGGTAAGGTAVGSNATGGTAAGGDAVRGTAPAAQAAPLRCHAHTAWTRHVLNTGTIFQAAYRSVSALPRGLSYAAGDASTWLAHRLMTPTTDALVDNFRAVFPDHGPHALRRLARATYRSYARDVVDFIRALSLDATAARALFATDTSAGPPIIETLLAQGRGVILVSGHFGNWEIGSVMMRAYGYPLTVVAMQEPSETVNRLRLEFRERVGVDTLEVRQSMDTALQIRRRLADNRVVAMLMDRHVDRDRVAVRFFGRRAFFLRTPALLGYLTGAPLLPCAIVRREGRPFDLITGTPIVVSRAEDRDTAVARAAQAFATQLETLIRATPQGWYQFYRYWDAQEEAASTPVDAPKSRATADAGAGARVVGGVGGGGGVRTGRGAGTGIGATGSGEIAAGEIAAGETAGGETTADDTNAPTPLGARTVTPDR